MSDWRWYPVNRVGGRCCLLALARVTEDDAEVAPTLVVLVGDEVGPGPESTADLDELDEAAANSITDEVHAVGTDAGHENWSGFEALREASFPRRRSNVGPEV